MPFKSYEPKARCPKCNNADVSTQYIKYGGRYGMPCQSAAEVDYRREHLHRHCRGCSYEWCEECYAMPIEVPGPAVEHAKTEALPAQS